MKFKFKSILVLIIAMFAIFGLAACGDKDDPVMKELNEALNSITLGDTSGLKADFDIVNFTNKHDFEITWSLENEDGTLAIEKKDDTWTTVKVTPSPYEEDAEGNQINTTGEGTLKATVSKDGKSASRTWELSVVRTAGYTSVTVYAAKRAQLGSLLQVEGVVVFVTTQGFFVEDATGVIYIFTKEAPPADAKAGAEVVVKGIQDNFYGMRQLKTPMVSVTKAAPAAGYDYSQAPEATIEELNAIGKDNLDQFGKLFKVTGRVIKDNKTSADGSQVSDWALQDDLTGEVLAIYNSTNSDLKTAIGAKLGEYVSLVILVNDHHSTQLVWRNYGIPGTLADADAPVIDDETVVANLIAQIEAKFKNKEFFTSLELITSGIQGSTVTWESDKPEIISNTGKLINPTEDTEVELTYTIVAGDLEETGTVTVTAKPAIILTVKEVIDAIDGGEDIFIATEGIIIGLDMDGYYYLADETGVVFVRNKLTDGLTVGRKVRVFATGTVYNKTSEYTRQVGINYSVEAIDEVIYPSPLTPEVVEFSDFLSGITTENLMEKVPTELLYGKEVTVTGFVTIQGSFNNVFLATSMEPGAPKMVIHHKSLAQDVLKALEGVEVTVTVVVYNYSMADGWRLSFMNREGDLSYELSEEDKLNLATAEIEGILTEDMEVKGNLNFIEESANPNLDGVKYTYSSDKTDIIANDGKFTAPEADTDVIITVKVFLDGDTSGTADKEIVVKVKAKEAEEVLPGALMIYEVYGGGGNSGAPYSNDYVVLYNAGEEDIDLSDYSLHYAGAKGEFGGQAESLDYDKNAMLQGTIKAKSFFVVQLSIGKTVLDKALPVVDFAAGSFGGMNVSASSGKLALAKGADIVVGITGIDDATVVDFVGFGPDATAYEGNGPTGKLSNTTSARRKTFTDTNDNATDFEIVEANLDYLLD